MYIGNLMEPTYTCQSVRSVLGDRQTAVRSSDDCEVFCGGKKKDRGEILGLMRDDDD